MSEPKKPKLGPVDYGVHPDRLRIFGGDGGEDAFDQAFAEEERRIVSVRKLNDYIAATGAVPEGVEVDLHASSHPAFSADAWAEYQKEHGVIPEATGKDSADNEQAIRELEEMLAAEKRRRNVS